MSEVHSDMAGGTPPPSPKLAHPGSRSMTPPLREWIAAGGDLPWTVADKLKGGPSSLGPCSASTTSKAGWARRQPEGRRVPSSGPPAEPAAWERSQLVAFGSNPPGRPSRPADGRGPSATWSRPVRRWPAIVAKSWGLPRHRGPLRTTLDEARGHGRRLRRVPPRRRASKFSSTPKHFFDGVPATTPSSPWRVLRAAHEARRQPGWCWCDTNGGTLPHVPSSRPWPRSGRRLPGRRGSAAHFPQTTPAGAVGPTPLAAVRQGAVARCRAASNGLRRGRTGNANLTGDHP